MGELELLRSTPDRGYMTRQLPPASALRRLWTPDVVLVDVIKISSLLPGHVAGTLGRLVPVPAVSSRARPPLGYSCSFHHALTLLVKSWIGVGGDLRASCSFHCFARILWRSSLTGSIAPDATSFVCHDTTSGGWIGFSDAGVNLLRDENANEQG